MHYLVYKITNRNNGKIYIGVHQTNDPNDEYMGSGCVLSRAIAKHGLDAFAKEILFDYDNPTEMFEKETELVNIAFVFREDTYNIRLGGHGGFDYVNRSGRNLYGLNGAIGNGRENLLPGKIIHERIKAEGRFADYCEMISSTLKKRYQEGTITNGFAGKKHSIETIEHLSRSRLGTGMGETNSQYGTRWVIHPETMEVQKVRASELDMYLSQGFLRGRKISTKRRKSIAHSAV